MSPSVSAFMSDFTPQLIALTSAMILWALWTYQRHTVGEAGSWQRSDSSFSWNPPRTKTSESVTSWFVSNCVLTLFVIWALKPFADLCLEAFQMLHEHLMQLRRSKECGGAGLAIQGKFTEYGACQGNDAHCNEQFTTVSEAPASHVLEPMLTWQCVHPTGIALNEGWCVWLEGSSISSEALRIAAKNIVQRHQALRLKFALSPTQTWTQQVMPLDRAFGNIFSQVDAPNDEPRALQLAEAALNTPFNIFDGPCARIGLVHVSPAKVLLYIVQHHAGTDAVSMSTLYEDFTVQYANTIAETNLTYSQLSQMAATLPLVCAELPTEDRLSIASKPGFKQSLEWLSKHLAGCEKLDLPTDYLRKPQPSFSCIQVPLHISPELSASIQNLSEREGVTVFDILLALQASWLCLTSRQEDVTIMTSHHSRTDNHVEGVVGCFRTPMPLRLTAQGSFKDLVKVASQVKKDGLQHCGGIPTMQLFELAGVDGHGGPSVLNYYSDRYKHAGISSLAANSDIAHGIQTSLVQLVKRSAIPDVELNVSKDVTGCLHGFATFSADLFSPATAERMAEHFCIVAANAITDTSRNVWDLPLLTPHAEELLDVLHGPHVEPQPTVVEMLARCMQKSFGNIAVEYEPTGERLTYGEFGARVCGLAAHLSTLGAGPDTLCALMLDRSVELIVAINSVWWAGAAYVPLDPNAPDKYVEFIVEDIHAHNTTLATLGNTPVSIVLTQSWILERHLLQQHFAHVLNLDTFKPREPFVGSKPAQGFPLGSQLCYSIYTSGSTGRPKGVLLEHNGLANYIDSCRQSHGIVSEDIILQKTPAIFDVSLYEFALPLVCGAKLLVAKHEGHKDVAYVADVIKRSSVTVARFVPSYCDIFLDHIKNANAAAGTNAEMALRVVGCSGEAMHAPTCLSFLKLLPKADLFDLYGPTEATVDVTQLECTGKNIRNGKTIGKPLPGCRTYVANFSEDADGCGRFTRTPLGLHGELLLGGVQLARGYLNLPAKTSEVFIKNPFQSDGFDTVYRTGDVVKWRDDGHLVYIGRADSQVKLSGARIELGEIESAVAKVTGVREAVVKMIKGDQGGAARLVVYVSPACAATEQVRKYCREVLPQHMVPSNVVGIDEWPRTASGKIDRKQLPLPQQEETEDQAQSLDVLVSKIRDLGIVGAIGDEEVQQQGWNSFQLMTLHAEMMRNPDKFKETEDGSPELQDNHGQDKLSSVDAQAAQVSVGVIAIVGHMWLAMMMLVLLEWLVAYWQWYQAVPEASSFNLAEFPILEKLNALGRFLGDPIFTMLCGIQDMSDVRAGNTGQLLRRTLLFIAISVVFTWVDRLLLQGPYVRLGWIDASWALDTSRMCGVLNGSVFVFARAVFIPVPLFLSMGRVSWMRGFGTEWPWACMVFALLLPAVMHGVPSASGFGDGSIFAYIQATRNFIIELSPYYFLYPLLVGGVRFPRGIATLKVWSSRRQGYAIALLAASLFFFMWKQLDIGNTSSVDSINSSHTKWRALLQNGNKVQQWPLLDLVKESFDLYAAGLVACFAMTIAAMMPVTPTALSGMGTKVIACYLTMPITLIAAGHFIAPCFLHITGVWRSTLVTIGVISTLFLIVSVTTAQPLLPDRLVRWASDSDK